MPPISCVCSHNSSSVSVIYSPTVNSATTFFKGCEAYISTSLPHLLLTLTNQKVEMISHQAIAIIGAVRSTRKPVIIRTHAHPIKSIDKLPIILFIFKAAIKRVQCLARLSIVEREQARPKVRDILMIDATHHHMKYPCARFLPRLTRHACITDPFIPSV